MTPEDKALARFTRERQQQRKRSAFDLDGGVEQGLTHYGQSLSLLDDADTGPIGQEEEPVRKTRAEIMQEVIAKSKAHKAERQQNADEDAELRDELDGEMAELRDLLNLPSRPQRRTADSPSPEAEGSGIDRALLAKIIGDRDSEEPERQPQTAEDDNYDRFVRELAFERRGQPADRTKTEEELAQEAREALENAERRRLARMEGIEDDEPAKKRRKTRASEADDLEDDFADEGDEDDAFGLGKGLAVDLPEEEEEPALEDDEEGSEEAEESDGEDEDAGFGLEVEDLLSDEEAEPETVQKPVRTERAIGKQAAKTELAYTFPCPTTHDELLEIFSGLENGQEGTVVQRIRVLHNARLHPDNTTKLQTLLGVLIEHVLYSTSLDSPDFAVVNALTPHIFALSVAYPLQAAEFFVAQLQEAYAQLVTSLPLWPSLSDLTLLRLIGLIWSTSDLSHPVAAPALLFICQSLGQCRTRSVADLSTGLFLCTLVLQYEALSKRLCPEAINYLATALLILGPHSFKPSNTPGPMPIPDVFAAGTASLKLTTKASKQSVAASISLLESLSVETATDELKAGLLSTTCKLISRFAELYSSLDAFIELLTPLSSILKTYSPSSLAAQLSKSTGEQLERMIRLSASTRRHLALQAHKPIPIPSFAPKFESAFTPGRKFDPDAERNEQAKLKALVKKERKGAIRELRKDARFLAQERTKLREEKDAAYNSKIKKIKAGLSDERSEEKKHLRAVAADKKRSGKGKRK